ncbi:12669_t:CDS:2 [Rhizophagus irregularis]|nr:12669_t:CDS:2 [Rhizophagus irregularis]
MTSSVEKGSQFESYVYNKLKSTKLCVSRTSRELEANRGPIDYMSPYYSKAFIVVRMDTPTPELLHASSSQYRENAVENMLETILRKLEKAEEDRREKKIKYTKRLIG